MSLTRLLIRDFRNIETADLALSPGFNFLVGANGSGKTSVLEAIYTLGHGRAFRSLQIGRVIRHEQEAFVLHGRLQGEERETAIGLTKDKHTWRAQYSAGIAADMADTCKQFLPEFSLTFSFQRGWEKETEYAEVLERNFERDRQLTYTAHGPHKADLRIRADGAPVEDTLSRGQLKLLMCALRLAQGEFLTRESGRRCLYLIDDFASELDDERRGLLASRLKATQSQVFVSAISAEHVIDMSDENSKMFTVEKGKITD
ncbi:AAA family ATPase [Escherichia coli]|uniref:AAA family ATPase n=1 Tax=Escherichia coli TaxID=562 RepID=UPI0034583D51